MAEDGNDHGSRIRSLELWRETKERLDDERYAAGQKQFDNITAQFVDVRTHLQRQDSAQEKMGANVEKLVEGQNKILLKLERADGAAEATEKLNQQKKDDQRFDVNTKIAIAGVIVALICGLLYVNWHALLNL